MEQQIKKNNKLIDETRRNLSNEYQTNLDKQKQLNNDITNLVKLINQANKEITDLGKLINQTNEEITRLKDSIKPKSTFMKLKLIISNKYKTKELENKTKELENKTTELENKQKSLTNTTINKNAVSTVISNIDRKLKEYTFEKNMDFVDLKKEIKNSYKFYEDKFYSTNSTNSTSDLDKFYRIIRKYQREIIKEILTDISLYL